MACGHERLRTIGGICTVEIISVLPDRQPPLALILISAERARDFPKKPVYLIGTGESVETPMVASLVIPAKAGI
jgi:hypothetical protein